MRQVGGRDPGLFDPWFPRRDLLPVLRTGVIRIEELVIRFRRDVIVVDVPVVEEEKERLAGIGREPVRRLPRDDIVGDNLIQTGFLNGRLVKEIYVLDEG